jgi:hypothetical protein
MRAIVSAVSIFLVACDGVACGAFTATVLFARV